MGNNKKNIVKDINDTDDVVKKEYNNDSNILKTVECKCGEIVVAYKGFTIHCPNCGRDLSYGK